MAASCSSPIIVFPLLATINGLGPRLVIVPLMAMVRHGSTDPSLAEVARTPFERTVTVHDWQGFRFGVCYSFADLPALHFVLSLGLRFVRPTNWL